MASPKRIKPLGQATILGMRFQAPRGTEDVLPSDAPKWQRLEAVFADITRRHGYQELRTPIFEDTELFTRTSGETSDIVTKEMYSFLDKGDRSITLKPEGTAPAMRAVIEHSLCPPGTVTRLRYTVPCFRYSRPQKGRLREFHQLGMELIGSGSPAADAEIIEVTYRYFEDLGLSGMTVMLNSIGREKCRQDFRDAIMAHMGDYLSGQSEEVQAKAARNPLRLLDSKDSDVQAALVGLAPITDFLEPECAENYAQLQRHLTDAEIPFCLRPDIVRGLDYYTETVFEILHDSMGGSSICGGGRYDRLVQELGGSPTPSVGVGIGMERVLLALDADKVVIAAPAADAFIVQASKEAYLPSLSLARSLRADGFTVLTDIDGKSMKSQLRQADKSGARFALILGDDELAKETVQMKDLAAGTQSECAWPQLAAALRETP